MEVIAWLQSHLPPTFDGPMLRLTMLGSEEVYVALMVLTFVTISAWAGRRLGAYFLVAVFLMELLKMLFDLPRPFELDPATVRVPEAIETAGGPTFPSGHALSAAAFWGLAASYVRRGWFTAVACVIVLVVAVSRVYLGVHFPADVIAGVAIGLLFVAGARALDGLDLQVAKPWLVVLGILVPLVLHLLLPTENSGLYMGALSAFVVGPALVPHRTDGPLAQRVLLGVVGVGLVFAALMGSSALVPDAVRHSALGSYFRYLLIGAVGTVLVPLIGRWTGLVPRGAPAAFHKPRLR